MSLLPFVHGQLEKLASSCLPSARRDQTLRTSALVNEAYLKLVGAEIDGEERGPFLHGGGQSGGQSDGFGSA